MSTQSIYNTDGIKITLVKKSGPGDIIGIIEKQIYDGYIDFEDIQFTESGDYVISVISDDDNIENIDFNISVNKMGDIISQEKTRGIESEDKKVEGTRPIISQISKPSIILPPMEYKISNNKTFNDDVLTGLGFVPFFYYKGFQIKPGDIQYLKLWYDGIVPKVNINFIDSNGEFKKDGFPMDDSNFEIFLNSGSKNLKSIHMQFKILEFKENAKKTYSITGSIDLKDFYKINFKSYRGNSFDVLKNISNELSLGYNSNITSTNDSMNWVNNGTVFKDFMSNIINHSYISDNSYVIGYIDFYYCFNYVDIEKEWKRDISDDVGISSTGVNHLNNQAETEKVTKMVLTNDKSMNASCFYFSKYKLNNNSTSLSVNRGHFLVSKTYDSLSKQFLVFDVQSQSEDTGKNVILKGSMTDNKDIGDMYRTAYSGKMDTENVHKNYYYSQSQNRINLENLSRISVDMELPIPNFNLYKFMKINVVFVNEANSINVSDVTNVRLTGEWVIVDISFTFIKGRMVQNLKMVRKELSKTEEEIKEGVTEDKTNNINNENNTNPIDDVSNLITNNIYEVGDVYVVENSTNVKYDLNIVELLSDGNNVNCLINEDSNIYTFSTKIEDIFSNVTFGNLTIITKKDKSYGFGDTQEPLLAEYTEDDFSGDEEAYADLASEMKKRDEMMRNSLGDETPNADSLKDYGILDLDSSAFVGAEWKKFDIRKVVNEINDTNYGVINKFNLSLKKILFYIKNDNLINDIRQASYLLATAYAESSYSLERWEGDYLCLGIGVRYNGQPCQKALNYFRSSKNKLNYYNLGTDSNGLPYFGRGLIMLTGKDNYRAYGRKFGVDLVSNGDLAFRSDISYKIAVQFLKNRTFKYVISGDLSSARRSVNNGTRHIDKVNGAYYTWVKIFTKMSKNVIV